MGLASALSTALTGLAASETTIDVVGNNLANSNTVGFKASQAEFATQFLQTLSLGSSPTGDSGGTNPRQIGLGTMVAEITPNFNQGTIEISSNPLDLAIQGDGFFIVVGDGGEQLYVRNGVFDLNSENQFVTTTGNRLLGFGVDDQFQIQRTELVPLEIPLGSAAVAQATDNVYLEGLLSPTGDLADTAERIQTVVLGDGSYTAPTTAVNTTLSQAPTTVGVGQAVGSAGVPKLTTSAGDFHYRFVFADSTTDTEGAWSSDYTVAVDAATSDIDLAGLPSDANTDRIRIYRTISDGDPAYDGTYYYVGEVDTSVAGPYHYTDTATDAALAAADTLNTDVINGNYDYYVTYYMPGGAESRPNPVATQSVGDGRIMLTNLPEPEPGDTSWTGAVRRIYRNVGSSAGEFHLVADNLPLTGDVTYFDSMSDVDLELVPDQLDFDGPKITRATRLVDVLHRDGSTYENAFSDAGTLRFQGRKGGRALDWKELTITENTTVGELVDFMEDALGIQEPPGADPDNPIPNSQTPPSGEVAPGGIVSNGRIILTGNNGVENALDISLGGMILQTTSATENINVPWTSFQSAVGESAVTDFLVYDSLGIPIQVRLTVVMESQNGNSTTYRWFADSPDNDPLTGADIAVGTGLIVFDGEGNVASATESTVSIERRNVSSASPLEFELDFSQITGLSPPTGQSSSLAVTRQDGSGSGTLTSFIIGEDGTIRGVFSNGITRDLGQIQLARFANPAGLEQRGENLYAEGVNSGLPVQGAPGQQGIGTVVAGAVELSNTDIGSSLIDLILASTMYRGNTRVITTAQQMIDELLSLRR